MRRTILITVTMLSAGCGGTSEPLAQADSIQQFGGSSPGGEEVLRTHRDAYLVSGMGVGIQRIERPSDSGVRDPATEAISPIAVTVQRTATGHRVIRLNATCELRAATVGRRVYLNPARCELPFDAEIRIVAEVRGRLTVEDSATVAHLVAPIESASGEVIALWVADIVLD